MSSRFGWKDLSKRLSPIILVGVMISLAVAAGWLGSPKWVLIGFLLGLVGAIGILSILDDPLVLLVGPLMLIAVIGLVFLAQPDFGRVENTLLVKVGVFDSVALGAFVVGLLAYWLDRAMNVPQTNQRRRKLERRKELQEAERLRRKEERKQRSRQQRRERQHRSFH